MPDLTEAANPTEAEIETMDALLRELLGDYEPPWSMRVIRNELLERFTLRPVPFGVGNE